MTSAMTGRAFPTSGVGGTPCPLFGQQLWSGGAVRGRQPVEPMSDREMRNMGAQANLRRRPNHCRAHAPFVESQAQLPQPLRVEEHPHVVRSPGEPPEFHRHLQPRAAVGAGDPRLKQLPVLLHQFVGPAIVASVTGRMAPIRFDHRRLAADAALAVGVEMPFSAKTVSTIPTASCADLLRFRTKSDHPAQPDRRVTLPTGYMGNSIPGLFGFRDERRRGAPPLRSDGDRRGVGADRRDDRDDRHGPLALSEPSAAGQCYRGCVSSR